jgi:hypothetical protein
MPPLLDEISLLYSLRPYQYLLARISLERGCTSLLIASRDLSVF